MELFIKAIQQDLAVLLPIFACSILVVWAAINRIIYYKKNERNKILIIIKWKEKEHNKMELKQ